MIEINKFYKNRGGDIIQVMDRENELMFAKIIKANSYEAKLMKDEGFRNMGPSGRNYYHYNFWSGTGQRLMMGGKNILDVDGDALVDFSKDPEYFL